jgi:hypothetical protein
MNNQNPTIGYFRYKGLYGSLARQSKLNQACKFVSQNFTLVTEFNYNYGKETPPRFIWPNVVRLIKKGLVKTVILSELADAETDSVHFAEFILFLKIRGIRLISLKENYDSKKLGHLYALKICSQNENVWKFNGFAA